MYKAVIFDIGQTLIQYNKPLNWSSLHKTALLAIAQKCSFVLSDKQIEKAVEILNKYNTRINPRICEVSSDIIFGEILDSWGESKQYIFDAKEAYYSYFRNDAYLFSDVKDVLVQLKKRGIKIGVLTDVAYGMDNVYAFGDISDIMEYIDFSLTSNDVGFRKPNTKGLELFADKMKIGISEIIYIGEEEKDIICANNAGAYSVLINCSDNEKNYGQKKEIKSLLSVLDILC